MATCDGPESDISTELQARNPDPVFQAPGFELLVTEGPDAGRRATIAYSTSPKVLIGQGPVCELRLTDRYVSRRHASAEVTLKGLRVIDLGSSNGTFVDGVSIEAACLRGGESLRLGATTMAVREITPNSATELPKALRFGRMVGASPEMRQLYALCERLAGAEIPVIIEGETGTGKEVLAEALHEAGPRKAGPFVVFDCTAVPPALLESALFGHEKGAFTGAVGQKRGVFEEADGGTLLLDEIGELDLALQPKLLRAIERSEIQRVGSSKWIQVDVRLLAATRRDLDREVHAGRFRDDLFFRLAVGRIELPPLRHRTGDVAVLAQHFLRELDAPTTALPKAFLSRLEDYAWPGNVRELYNTIARFVALGDVDVVGLSPAPEAPLPSASGVSASEDAIDRVLALDLPLPRARQQLVAEFERRYVARVLDRYGGNVVRAAAASGIARRYFQILKARNKS